MQCLRRVNRDSWHLQTRQKPKFIISKLYITEKSNKSSCWRSCNQQTLVFFCLINHQIHQLINFLSVGQLCQHYRESMFEGGQDTCSKSTITFSNTYRWAGEEVSSGLRVTERLRWRVTHGRQPRSTFWQNDQRFMATPCSLLLNCSSTTKRGMFTSSLRPCRQHGVHQISPGWVKRGK